jgi:hypothetical protein
MVGGHKTDLVSLSSFGATGNRIISTDIAVYPAL